MTRNPFFAAAMLMSAMVVGAALALAQDTASPDKDGQALFNNSCRTCHSVKSGDNRLGPSLAGVIGAKSGAQQGFTYSAALQNGAVTWDEKTLDAFITNPDAAVPGNNMKPFAGITAADDRAKIITFLKSGGGNAVD